MEKTVPQGQDWPPPGNGLATFTQAVHQFSAKGMVRCVDAEKETADTFTYDPGNLCLQLASFAAMLSTTSRDHRDQRAAENRSDVLVYSTKPLAEDMEVTTRVSLELPWAKSSRWTRTLQQTRRRRAGWLGHEFDGRNSAHAFSRFSGETGAYGRIRSTKSRWTCGLPATSSRRPSAAGFPAAISHASIAT